MLFKRSEGYYTKLDVVVRVHDTMDNVIDYAFLNDKRLVVWQDGGDKIGVGARREAGKLLRNLERLEEEERNNDSQFDID